VRIGYIVQGPTDRAFLSGLRDRWCPGAELRMIGLRGTQLRPRDYPKVCAEAILKGDNFIVILTDSDVGDWEAIREREMTYLSGLCELDYIVGVCARNVESWLCADTEDAARQLGWPAEAFDVDDPKPVFEKAIGITRDDNKVDEIAAMVRNAPPLKRAFSNRAYKRFYEDARDIAQRRGCPMRNELEG
jgi:hypothetical protein